MRLREYEQGMRPIVSGLYTLWYLLAPLLGCLLFGLVMSQAALITFSVQHGSYWEGLSETEWLGITLAALLCASAYLPLARLRGERGGGRGLLLAFAWPLLGLLFMAAGLAALYL